MGRIVGARLDRGIHLSDVSPLISSAIEREVHRIGAFAQELATGSRLVRF